MPRISLRSVGNALRPAAIALRAASRPAAASSPPPQDRRRERGQPDQRRTRRGVLLDHRACRTVPATFPDRRSSVSPRRAVSLLGHRRRHGISVRLRGRICPPRHRPRGRRTGAPTHRPESIREQESLRVGSGVGDGDRSRSQDRHRSPTSVKGAEVGRQRIDGHRSSALASTASDRASSPISVLSEAIPVAPMPIRGSSRDVRAMLPWPRRRAVGSAVGRCCRPLRWRLRGR